MSSYADVKRQNRETLKRFKRNFGDLIDEEAQKILEEEVGIVQDEAEEIANKELLQYFSVVSEKMGLAKKPRLKDPRSSGFYTYNVFDRVIWLPLSPKTREMKRKLNENGNPNAKWYSYKPEEKTTGGKHLKDYLRGLGFSQSCTVAVKEIPKSGPGRPSKLKNYSLSLSIPLDEDSIIKEMDEEQAGKAFSPDSRNGQVNEVSRPIFNPIAQYFIHQRIPRVIAEKMEGKRNVKFT